MVRVMVVEGSDPLFSHRQGLPGCTLVGNWAEDWSQVLNTGTLMWDAGISGGILTAVPNTHSWRVLTVNLPPATLGCNLQEKSRHFCRISKTGPWISLVAGFQLSSIYAVSSCWLTNVGIPFLFDRQEKFCEFVLRICETLWLKKLWLASWSYSGSIADVLRSSWLH